MYFSSDGNSDAYLINITQIQLQAQRIIAVQMNRLLLCSTNRGRSMGLHSGMRRHEPWITSSATGLS